jgi:hypothetical protein
MKWTHIDQYVNQFLVRHVHRFILFTYRYTYIMSEFQPYPDIYTDPNFYSKIYSKKEFHSTKARRPDQQITIEEACNPPSFTLQNYQQFARNFISMNTPYNGLLLFWGVGVGKCVTPETVVYINGGLMPIEHIWEVYHRQTTHEVDGSLGEWAEIDQPLMVNCYNQDTQQMIECPIKRLYRQKIREPIRNVSLHNGTHLRLTRQHHLLTETGWTNQLQTVKTVAVPSCLVNTKHRGFYGDDLAFFLGWHMATGNEYPNGVLMMTGFDESICNDLINAFRRVCDQYHLLQPTYVVEKCGTLSCLQLTSTDYVQLLEKFGYQWEKPIEDKGFPTSLITAPFHEVEIFMKSYCQTRALLDEEHQCWELRPVMKHECSQLTSLLHLVGIRFDQKPLGNYISISYTTSQQAQRGVHYVEIDHLSEEDYDGYVYDLEIPTHHNYVANEILCHNTCAGVHIAEGLKPMVEKMNKKIYVLVNDNIRPNWIRALYNPSKEEEEKRLGLLPGSKQCIGSTYYQYGTVKHKAKKPKSGVDVTATTKAKAPMSPAEIRNKNIVAKIKETYKFLGPRKFVNDYQKLEEACKKTQKNLDQEIIDKFSNCVFIIDEVHELAKPPRETGGTDDKGPKTAEERKEEKKILLKIIPSLLKIFSTAKDIKLILTTATPMRDRAQDFVTILNLLLANDKRPLIDQQTLFPEKDQVTPTTVALLKNIAKGYVSYVKGEDPVSFPIVIDARNENLHYPSPAERKLYKPRPLLDDHGELFPQGFDDYVKSVDLIRCPMSPEQFSYYCYAMQHDKSPKKTKKRRSGDDDDEEDVKNAAGRQLSNMAFPLIAGNETAVRHGTEGFKNIFDEQKGEEGGITYQMRSGVPPDFLKIDQIGRYSKRKWKSSYTTSLTVVELFTSTVSWLRMVF